MQPFTIGKAQAMGGLAYGFRDSYSINPLNPAASTSVAQNTFMMDLALSGCASWFDTGSGTSSQFSGNLEYVAFQMPLGKFAALSFGLLPYSSVGYSYYTESTVPTYVKADSTALSRQTFEGDGGFTQVYLGVSFDILDRVAIGIQGKYMFGKVEHGRQISFTSDNSYTTTTSISELNVSTFLVDFGLQYHQPIGTDELIIGAAYSLSLPMNIWGSTTTTTTSTKTVGADGGFDFPHSGGAGISYRWKDRLLVGVDYSLQHFSGARYYGRTDTLVDRHKVAIGAEYVHDLNSKKYVDRIRFRIGANYANSYTKVNGASYDEFAITAGMGFPLFNAMTILNFYMEYGHRGSMAGTRFVEQYFKFGLGISLNERWFVKRKFN